ncbi:MAG: nucleotidyltransferase domain-containing protein, partial [Gammaproteobacteria bacterium]|nr:nucleotidyltransferase domain-containing protein [Gammaproteobacteria bacterium]
GQNVDVVVLDDAPPGLAYRVFRDGVTVLVRDRSALVERKARTILEYLDFRPVEEALSRAVLARRTR